MIPEDRTQIISAQEGRRGTPKKYAGPKFHTTSPSPKSLPIPVFSSGLPRQSLSSSLPTTTTTVTTATATSSSFLKDSENPFLLDSSRSHASQSTSSLPSNAHHLTQGLKSQPIQQKNPDPPRQTRRRTHSNNESSESRMKVNSAFKGNTFDSETSPTLHSSKNVPKTVGCISILSRDRKFEQKSKDVAIKPSSTSRHRKRTSDPNPSLHSMSHDLKQILRIVDARAS